MGVRQAGGRSGRWVGRPSVPRAVLTLSAAVALAGCSAAADPADGTAPAAPEASLSSASEVLSPNVAALVETDPVPHTGDAADDPAVWANPADPSMSAIVGTDKQGGMLVYDLTGRQLQYLPVGEMNNVDLRPAANGFTLGGSPVVLVVSGNRSDNTIRAFVLDPDTRQLRDVAGDAIRPDLEVYGSCLYRSATTRTVYAFVNSKEGEVEQWRLSDDGAGGVVGEQVRSFRVESQVEGCVADDELGAFYLGEETTGIWKFGAEPDAGDAGELIAPVTESGPLVGQVEGLTLAYGDGGAGYLIASSQGDSSFAVFRREGDNGYVGSFRIVPGGGIDGTDHTDGIDVVTAGLGPSFPSGVLVAQDGENDGEGQNFKLVPLEDVLPR
ncbi:phytase [Blastococcus sp. CT_GayMR19]|uniref:phytase n=1 Tax=Blastococcus sp. CT_GayMR19 TaxID=2559608 RepID=UPI001431939F|nr:phytase [Blastococcus sp. CT_GayMR19]